MVACGDDSSSVFPDSCAEPCRSTVGDLPSSESLSSSDDNSSSSSVKSSSSAKSSSSTDDKSSSSVTSSSSSLKSCPPEKEGKTRTIVDSGEKQICQDGYWIPMESSSSSEARRICKEEEEGETQRVRDQRFVCEGGYWVPIESSSSADVSSSSYFDMTEQFNPDVEYGEFTDPRDGQKYRTMEVKNGVFMESYTVFAENLNYGKMVSGGSVQGDSSKYCYDDEPWHCENGWGGLYTWSRAMNFPTVCDSFSIASEKCPNKFNLVHENEKFNGQSYFVQHQGICPEGWHIMNENEWVEVSEQSSVSSMRSEVAGFGNNNYGLSILPTGYWERFPDGTSIFKNIKKQTLFWLPQQDADNVDYAKHVNIMSSDMTRGNSRSKYKYAHSIRCVKNY